MWPFGRFGKKELNPSVYMFNDCSSGCCRTIRINEEVACDLLPCRFSFSMLLGYSKYLRVGPKEGNTSGRRQVSKDSFDIERRLSTRG